MSPCSGRTASLFRRALLAASVVTLSLAAADAEPVACPSNSYATTQAANQALNTAQQANNTATQARYGLNAGIGGLIGLARGALATVQTAQRPAAPPCPVP